MWPDFCYGLAFFICYIHSRSIRRHGVGRWYENKRNKKMLSWAAIDVNKRLLKYRVLPVMMVLNFPVLALAQGNVQTVNAKSSITNKATGGGTAVTHIASVRHGPVPAGNKQVVDVQAAIVNSASGGATSELNMASRTRRGASGNQLVSVGGPVVNEARGKTRSVLSIGSAN